MLQSYNNINTNGYYKPNVKGVKYHYENLELKIFKSITRQKRNRYLHERRRNLGNVLPFES